MLQVNDKVFTRDNRYGELKYRVFTVERVTPTTAILNNGTKLRNKLESYAGKTPYYNEIGQSYKSYFLINDDVQREIEQVEKENRLSTWYANFSPTIEQVEQIYNLINQKS